MLCGASFGHEDCGMGKGEGSGYLTDVTDEEWLFVLPYLLLSREDNGSRQHDLRAIFNAVRYVVKGGNQWRVIPHGLPPRPSAVSQMLPRVRGRWFETMAAWLRPCFPHLALPQRHPPARCPHQPH